MKTEELDQALAAGFRLPAQPKPQGPVLVSQALEVDQAAMTFARKWRLIRPDGTVKCANEWCGGDATLPTLECRDCRKARLGA